MREHRGVAADKLNIENALCKYLETHHRGASKTISSKKLEVVFSVTGAEIRRAVNAFRCACQPICSDTSGYYFGETQKEIMATVAQLNGRVQKIVMARDGLITRSTKERTYVRYINGQKITKTVTPVLGEKAAHNGNVVYSLDFQVTPHQLRHTYITNLIYASVDPKTVQYLAGHENSKITMDIYAKVKYNKPEQLSAVVNTAFGQPA